MFDYLASDSSKKYPYRFWQERPGALCVRTVFLRLRNSTRLSDNLINGAKNLCSDLMRKGSRLKDQDLWFVIVIWYNEEIILCCYREISEFCFKEPLNLLVIFATLWISWGNFFDSFSPKVENVGGRCWPNHCLVPALRVLRALLSCSPCCL
jgi:hypothetical protein